MSTDVNKPAAWLIALIAFENDVIGPVEMGHDNFLPRCSYTMQMQARYCDKQLSICLSVRLSVYQTRELWQNEST